MSPAVPVRLTCQTCARRKAKCDKKSPCTNCLKNGIPCIAVERPCWPRGRSGKQTTSREGDLSNRVAKLEQKLQDLIQSERGSTLNVEAIPLQTGGSQNRPSKNVQTTDGSPAQILPPADNRDDAPGSGIASHTMRHEHHVGNPWEPLSEPVRRKILLDIYLHQVDPTLKILHRPSLCSYLMEGKSYLGYPREHPVPAALASAVLYMASSSIAEDQCLALLAERKETVLTRHKDDAKTALAKVDFLVTTDLTVLQAFVLSLVAARTHDHSRRAWTMLSVALRIAQGLSLHKPDPPGRATPFEREMRRRLWQVIGWLDLETSLNRGSECMMRSAWLMSHTLTNVNDDAFGLETEEPLPVAQSGQSEATLLMIFAHGQCALRALDLSHFNEPAVTDIRNRQQIVDQFRYTADGLLAGSDPENIAFHWFTKLLKQQISGVLQLIALRPFQTSPNFVPAELPSPQILALATEILQRRQTLYNDPRSQPWRWIEPLFFPWHALLVAITEVCACMNRLVIDKYWATLEYNYDFFQKQAVGPDSDWLITSMENLMSSARAARQSAFVKDASEDIAPHSHFYMEMSSLGSSVLPGSLPAGFPAISTEIQELSQIQDYEGIEWTQYVDLGNGL